MEERTMRITPEEIDLLKSTFKGNEKLIKLLRKIFLPEVNPEAPLGQNIDLWMTVPIKELSPEEAMVNIIARNNLIQHVETQLLQLKILADTEAKTLEEIRENLKKDSSK
jgi:hypothetical protein